MSLIKTEGLTKRFGGVTDVSALTVDIPPGLVVDLVAPQVLSRGGRFGAPHVQATNAAAFALSVPLPFVARRNDDGPVGSPVPLAR